MGDEEEINCSVEVVPKKSKCRLFHDWSKWGSRVNYSMVAVYTDGSRVPFVETRQARKCDRCEKIQERKL